MDIITRSEAKAQHLTAYYTGEPCKHGHVALRNTKDGGCYECCRARSEARREKHPTYASDKYHTDIDRRKQHNSVWYNENRQQVQHKYDDPQARAKHYQRCADWRRRYKQVRRLEKAVAFSELIHQAELPQVPTERDFKYWLAGELHRATGATVYNEQFIDEERTSRIDLLIPELMLGIECKLSSHNWRPTLVEAQRLRYEQLLAHQGYTVIVASLDGSIGVSATQLLASLQHPAR